VATFTIKSKEGTPLPLREDSSNAFVDEDRILDMTCFWLNPSLTQA